MNFGRNQYEDAERQGRADDPFQNKQFRWLFSSNLLSFLAINGQNVVRTWLAFELTGSKFALGQMAAAFAIPLLIFAPLGGVIADRVERRTLIMIGQVTILSGELFILILLWSGRLEFIHLLVLMIMVGCAYPLALPARQAIVVNLVGKEGLPGATALNMGAMNASRVIGPLLSGSLIGIVGSTAAYSLGVSLYIGAFLCLFGVHRFPNPNSTSGQSMAKGFLEGIQYMHINRLVPILLIFGLIPGLLSMPLQQMLVAFCEEIWEVGAAGFSTLLVVAGIGGVAGSAALGRRTRKHLTAFVMIGCLAAFSITTVGFSMSPSFWMAVPLLLAANFFSTAFGILNSTAIQLIIPDHVRGRVTSFLMFTFSFPLLACLPVGALADQWGAPYAVATIALFTLVVGIGFYLGCSRLRHLADAIPVSMPRARVPEAIPAPAK